MLTTTTPQITFDTDGATLAFDFSFKMWSDTVDDELAVVFNEGEDDEATLALTTDYTLSAANNDYSDGGTVTLVSGSDYAADGNTITIKSDLLRSQTYDLQHGGDLNTDSLEQVLDRYVRMIQEAELQGTIEQTAITAFYKTQLTKSTAEEARDSLLIYPVIQCYENEVQCYENEVQTYV
jgi:CRISPR/Cas system-associated endoribonuclease Cas2